MLHAHLCIPSVYSSEMLMEHPGYSQSHRWVSIVTSLQMGWPGVQFPAWTRDLHPPRFLMPDSIRGWGVEVTTHLHLMLRSRKSGFKPLLPIAPCAIMVWTGTALLPQTCHAVFTVTWHRYTPGTKAYKQLEFSILAKCVTRTSNLLNQIAVAVQHSLLWGIWGHVRIWL